MPSAKHAKATETPKRHHSHPQQQHPQPVQARDSSIRSGSKESLKSVKSAKQKRDETRIQIDSPPVCRICYDGQSAEKGKPIVVCNCKASFAYVHPKCISDWLSATDATQCDICRFPYLMHKKPETFMNWYRSQDKGEEYKITIQTCGLYSFELFVATILFIASYGDILLILSFLLAGCVVFWLFFLTGSIMIYMVRECKSFREWKATHYRIEVKPNPKPDDEIAAPPFNLARAAGLNKKATTHSSSHPHLPKPSLPLTPPATDQKSYRSSSKTPSDSGTMI